MKTRLAAVVATSLALACAQDNNAVQLYAICSPPDSCTFGATCDKYAMDVPTLDVTTSATGVLLLAIEVHNQAANNADPTAGRVNTHDAFVQEYDVAWKDSALPPVKGRITQTVPAAGSTVVAVPIQPPLAPGRFVAKLSLRGVFGDQSGFTTAPLEIAVAVCSGCLAAQTAACTKPCPPNIGQLPIACGTTP